MRRKDRALDEAQTREILREGEYGVLSTAGPGGRPYGVPLSYVLDADGSISFHCARTGHKITNLEERCEVSFAVVTDVQAAYLGDFTTRYRSAIVHGTAEQVQEPGEKIRLLRLLCEKYLPEYMEHFDRSIQASLAVTAVWKIKPEATTGKARQ